MMAKRPSSKISMSSGQGVSRKSYQSARGLGQNGTGASGLGGAAIKPAPMPSGSKTTGKTREYGKAEGKSKGLNYGRYDEGIMRNATLDKLQKWPK